MQTRPGLGVAMVLAAAALWGTTGTAQSLAGGQFTAGWFGALRLVVATGFFALYALATHRSTAFQPVHGPCPGAAWWAQVSAWPSTTWLSSRACA